MYLKLKNPLAFFDLETTGINVCHDRIVEISIVKLMPNGEKIIKTKKVNPTIPIPIESSLIHGIYDEDVKDAPIFKNIAKSLAQFIEGCDLAGFNIIKFDVPLLVEEFLRAGVDFDVSHRKLIDAQKIFHMMEPRTLGAAVKFYCGKTLENAHSAEADTLATLEVLDAQVQLYENRVVKDSKGVESVPIKNDMQVLHNLSASKMVDLAGRMIYNDKGIEIFNFGKHKDKPVVEVLKIEPTYYEWVMNGDFPLNTKKKLTEIKLRGFGLRR
jgi:DNA polymerase III subunit epsilon